jgi:8-oxo-dGTP pyrophosphatase MutT (NUDIX family)
MDGAGTGDEIRLAGERRRECKRASGAEREPQRCSHARQYNRAAVKRDRIEQAGGVIFRQRRGRIEVLLVRSKKDPSIWVFPKGHVEPGESRADAALRETQEEAGVDGEVLGAVGEPLEFMSGREAVRVHYFLIRATGSVLVHENRETCWLPFDQARRSLAFESARDILAAAEAAITAWAARPVKP